MGVAGSFCDGRLWFWRTRLAVVEFAPIPETAHKLLHCDRFWLPIVGKCILVGPIPLKRVP